MSAKQIPPDVRVTTTGIGFYTITPTSVAARDWLAEHADIPDWAWLGNAFHMDNGGLVANLVNGMTAAGLRVAA